MEGENKDAERAKKDAVRKEKQERLTREKIRKEYFEHYDANKNGVLEPTELRKFVDDICEKTGMPKFDDDFFSSIWKNADDDGNASIDFEEFMKHFGKFCPMN